MRKLLLVSLLVLPFQVYAQLLVNGGAEVLDEFGDPYRVVGWKRTPIYAPAYTTTALLQGSGIVRAFEGTHFFTFAAEQYPPEDYPSQLPYPGPIVMSQTGTRGLDASGLLLTGWFQTEFGDSAEVTLSVLDGDGGVIDRIATGFITTPNLKWESFPELELLVPPGAVSWMVELSGDLVYGIFVNVHFDGIQLASVPEPGSLGMLGAGLLGVGVMRRKRTA